MANSPSPTRTFSMSTDLASKPTSTFFVFPPTHVLVGTGASGAILYEIGVIEREWIPGTYEHVIVHAMRARLTYEMKWLTMQYQDGDNDEI